MFSSPAYTVPPSAFAYYDTSTPLSASSSEEYFTPQYAVYTASPQERTSSRRRSRRATNEGRGVFVTPDRANLASYIFSSPFRSADSAGSVDRTRPKLQRSRAASGTHRGRMSQTYPQVYDSSDEDLHDYLPRESRHARPYGQPAQYESYVEHVPIHRAEEPTVRRSRARRSSHSTRPSTSPQQTKTQTNDKASSKHASTATEVDRVRKGIPAGYSMKNWDPSEEPIILLGSVFDANSLGKWIYDWTIYHHGASTPMSEIAGELWLLLIQVAGKIKRAEQSVPRIRRKDNRAMIQDFLQSGERLWSRIRRLLKACEQYMWKAAKRPSRGKSVMGENSGCEFVDAMFGRDRELEKTEKLMTGMRLWSMRFDANCDEILRRPSA
ncbi:MAG: hypothetical protein M1817_005589 [Caeruleum heppii]|nr:MAG: hypothetical protein M1817_005589 [Caeruleum heppii]